MPRSARRKSETGIYHIMLRGINRQIIFYDDEDRNKLLDILTHFKKVSNFDVYGYCFMDNHIHLLIKEKTEAISVIMKRICSSFVYWYNHKYERCGHLFQERYKSEPVESDVYFLTVLRYIHQNPLKAKMTANIADYFWSSYHEYTNIPVVTDINFALDMFSLDKNKSIKSFKEFTNQLNEDICLDYGKNKTLSDHDIRSIFKQYYFSDINQLNQFDKKQRDEIIKHLKSLDGATTRQLSKLTGVSRSTIDRI